MREAYPLAGQFYRYRLDEQEGALAFEPEDDEPDGLSSAVTFRVEPGEAGEGVFRAESGRTRSFAWAWVGPELHLWLEGDLFVFQRADSSASPGRRRGPASATEGPGDVSAPMPGAVLEVLVAEGDRVERNQTVVVMESMKMELLITAPRDGVVRRVAVQPGQQVERGMRLLELASGGDAGEE